MIAHVAEPNEVTKNKVSLEIFLLAYFGGLILHFIWSQYYDADSERSFGFLFAIPNDYPGTVSPNLYTPVLGKHFFGDLLDGHDLFPVYPSGAYFGVSYLFFWITQGIHYDMVFGIYILSGSFLAIISIKRWLKLVLNENKALVYVLHFAYPFVFAADRGQMALIFGYLLAIAFSYLVESNANREKLRLGQMILGIALSIKVSPLLIVLGLNRFWSFKKWRLLFSSFILFCALTPLISLYLTNSIFHSDFFGGPYFDDAYFKNNAVFNTSLKNLLLHINEVSFFKPLELLIESLFTNFSIFYVMYTVLASVCVLSKSLTLQENLLAFAILSISLAPYAAVYTQVIVCAVALIGLTENLIVSRKRHNLFWFVVVISTVPLNIPLRSAQNIGYEMSFQGFVVPLVQHSYLFLLMSGVLTSDKPSWLSRLNIHRAS